MTKLIGEREIADQDETYVLLYTGELLEKSNIQILKRYPVRRAYQIRGSVHMNGTMAAPARPYGVRPGGY